MVKILFLVKNGQKGRHGCVNSEHVLFVFVLGLSQSFQGYIGLSLSILVYVCLSILGYLGLSWSILRYLLVSWAILSYFGLSLAISGQNVLPWLYFTISCYLFPSLAISGYLRLSLSSIRVQFEGGESKLLVFKTFCFCLHFTDTSYRGARAPKKLQFVHLTILIALPMRMK